MKIDRSFAARLHRHRLGHQQVQEVLQGGVLGLGLGLATIQLLSRLAQNGPRKRENTAWISAFFEPK